MILDGTRWHISQLQLNFCLFVSSRFSFLLIIHNVRVLIKSNNIWVDSYSLHIVWCVCVCICFVSSIFFHSLWFVQFFVLMLQMLPHISLFSTAVCLFFICKNDRILIRTSNVRQPSITILFFFFFFLLTKSFDRMTASRERNVQFSFKSKWKPEKNVWWWWWCWKVEDWILIFWYMIQCQCNDLITTPSTIALKSKTNKEKEQTNETRYWLLR